MNNNSSNEPALLANCKGVFQPSSYINFGTKEKPLTYPVKPSVRSCYKNKQLLTNPSKDGHTPDVYFAQGWGPDKKKHVFISDGAKYIDRTYYSDQQKEKRKGFNSGDFKRRDEFSNTIRVAQFREQLNREGKHSKRIVEMLKAGNAGDDVLDMSEADLRKATTSTDKYRGMTLYDRIFESEDTKEYSRQARDTKNPTKLSNERDFGTYKTMSQMVGMQANDITYSKPAYARKPIVRDTFYRRTGCLRGGF